MNPQAYPLQWPANWPRVEQKVRAVSKMKTALPSALSNLRKEVQRFGGANLVLSSNCTLGNSSPSDPGVVAYFNRGSDPVAIPCDRWSDVASNVQAIAKTIEALRGIERWGAKHMVKASLAGFLALPSTAVNEWWVVLGVDRNAPADEVNRKFRELAKLHHPDTPGGSVSKMAEINNALEMAKKERNQ